MKVIFTECNCHVDSLLPYKPFPLEAKVKVNLYVLTRDPPLMWL